MQRGTIIELLRDDRKHECAHRGQLAHVWRVYEDGSLYVELKCGHPWVVPRDGLGTIYRVVEEPSESQTISSAQETAKEKKMPRGKKTSAVAEEPVVRQATVPTSRGVIPVQGFEREVLKFKTSLRFFEQLEREVEDGKAFFRDQSDIVVGNVEGEVHCVEFLAPDGSTVPVTLPDRSKTGNRNSIKPELISEVARLGYDLVELKVTEAEHTFILRGAFVDWFRGILQDNYVSQGLAIPEGIEEKVTTRLSTEGVAKLEKLTKEFKTEGQRTMAKLLLKQGIRAAAVTVK